ATATQVFRRPAKLARFHDRELLARLPRGARRSVQVSGGSPPTVVAGRGRSNATPTLRDLHAPSSKWLSEPIPLRSPRRPLSERIRLCASGLEETPGSIRAQTIDYVRPGDGNERPSSCLRRGH